MKEIYKIVSGSQRCFIDPPLYPTYKYHISGYYGIEEIASISIQYAITNDCNYLPSNIRARAEKLINNWYENKPSLNNPDVKKWIYETLGYFSNCYRDKDGSYNASNLRIHRVKDEKRKYKFILRCKNIHAGIHHIKKFYPEYKPTIDDLKRAKWGNQ